MKNIRNLFVLYFLSLNLTYCQLLNSTWVVADGGGSIVFDSNSSGTPSSGPIGNMNASEGLASVSDNCGNLIMYTNGAFLYDGEGTLIYDFVDLHTENSSQGSLFLPKPCQDNCYDNFYLFKVEHLNLGSASRLVYYEISINTGTPTVIAGPITIIDGAAERLSFTKHSNGTDYWLVSTMYNSDIIFRAKVSCDGISCQETQTLPGNIPINWNETGCMKFNYPGTKLAIAYTFQGVHVFDFNNTTGVISNLLSTYDNETGHYAYGVEFSMDDKLFYTQISTDDTSGGMIIIVDPNTTTSFSVTNNSSGWGPCSLQMGPDGNIYVAIDGTTQLGVFSGVNGDSPIFGYINLGPNQQVGMGLPQLVPSLDFCENCNSNCCEELKSLIESLEVKIDNLIQLINSN